LTLGAYIDAPNRPGGTAKEVLTQALDLTSSFRDDTPSIAWWEGKDMTETIEPMVELEQDERQVLAQELVDRARAEGVDLIGPDGLLTKLTKTVLETALEEEISEHLGYDKHDPLGRNGENSRNGTRTKTVLTEIGAVEIDVPRDRGLYVRAGHREEAAAPPRRGGPARPVADGAGFDDG
jgi:hypothetical protein